MAIKIKRNAKHINQLVLVVFLGLLQPVKAGLLDPPVISYSVTDCRKSYLVQLFEDGRIEYRGGTDVKTRGWQTGHTSPQAVQAILKKIDADPIFATDDRENLPAKTRDHGMSAIHIRQANRDMTFYGGGSWVAALLMRPSVLRN